MSNQEPRPGAEPRRSNRTMSWIAAITAAVAVVLILVFWNSFNTSPEDQLADQTPVLNDQNRPDADMSGVDAKQAGDNLAKPEAAQSGQSAEGDGPVENAGQAVAAGPPSPQNDAGSGGGNAVANEAAREDEAISNEADKQSGSPVTQAQRTAEKIKSGDTQTQ